MAIHELPCLHALCLCVVSEGLFAKLTTQEVWGWAGVDFITPSGKKVRSKEIMLMAILITDGVGEGKLGMVTIFCCSNQAKVEPSVMLLTLVQQDSHDPAVMVMKIFTNLPSLPWGSFGISFLNIATLPGGASTIWFPLSWLCLCQLFLCFSNQVILPRRRQIELSWRSPQSQQRHRGRVPSRSSVSSLMPLSLPLLVLATSLSTYKDRGLQTNEGLDFNMALKQLQVAMWAES